MIQALIFDLDGTLIDSRLDLACAVNLTRRHYHLPELSVAAVVGCVGNGIRNLARRSLSELPEAELETALAHLRNVYGQHEVDATTLYPGVAEGLAALAAAGFKLAVATNKPEQNAVNICRKLDIAKYLDRTVGAGAGVALKPEPDALLLLAGELELELSRCWMVGDHYTDMAAARRAHAVRVFAKWGFGRLGDETCDLAFECFGDLVAAALATGASSPA